MHWVSGLSSPFFIRERRISNWDPKVESLSRELTVFLAHLLKKSRLEFYVFLTLSIFRASFDEERSSHPILLERWKDSTGNGFCQWFGDKEAGNAGERGKGRGGSDRSIWNRL